MIADPHDGYTCAENEVYTEKVTEDFNDLSMFVNRRLVKLYTLWFELAEHAVPVQSATYRVCANALKDAIESRRGDPS